ncbi:hypothetical protein [Mangrovimonas sp. TPBH4]|uniref:hypothetical protein n=1 Tax=Mangrovimonas sp. TPBH4 TaxID=1645914 RepID=UPI0006B403F0|nr:hypothetical protein [Mangrovimonas sp. TPBH4]
MNDFVTNWTKDELKAYIMIFCSHADFNESEDEKAFIKSKIQDLDLASIHREFDKDNDYQSIQKIRSSLSSLNYNPEELETLISEIKELFMVDGHIDTLEHNLLLGLKHILKDP